MRKVVQFFSEKHEEEIKKVRDGDKTERAKKSCFFSSAVKKIGRVAAVNIGENFGPFFFSPLVKKKCPRETKVVQNNFLQ